MQSNDIKPHGPSSASDVKPFGRGETDWVQDPHSFAIGWEQQAYRDESRRVHYIPTRCGGSSPSPEIRRRWTAEAKA